MKNMFVIVLCLAFLGCDAVATLFHGEKPEVTYTVTFDANEAIGNPPAEKTVKAGEVIRLPNIGGMTRSGNTFVGWSESATIGVGVTLFVDDTITVTRDMTFYAQWISNSETKYVIRFYANGASGAPPPSREVYAGVQIRIPDKGSLGYTGKMFGGWNTEQDGSGMLLGADALYTVSSGIDLYAQWYALTDTFTVTFDKNGGSGDVPSPQTVNAGATINLPNGSSLSKDGYIFGGWNTNDTGTGVNYDAGYLYTVTGNVTLFAKWNSFFSSVAEVSAFLASQISGFEPDDPIYLPVQINLGTMTQNGSGWRQLLNIIANSGKYVDLDLSACTMNGTEFDPDINTATGKDMIVSITLPDTAVSVASRIKYIGNYSYVGTFGDFTELKSFKGTGITSIGDYAFYRTRLTMTELPTNLTSIGKEAFSDCYNLALTSLPAGITSIGDHAFYWCRNLALTSLPTGLTLINTWTFTNCENMTITSLPTGVISIGYMAFSSCENITLIDLPKGLTSIDNAAFLHCLNLNLVICHAEEPPAINSDSFFGTPTTMQIKVPSASVTAYKTAPVWSEYADRISAIE